MTVAARTIACLAAGAVLAACSAGDDPPPTASPTSATSAAPSTAPTPGADGGSTGTATQDLGGVELAAVPASTRGWASSVGLPVVGAVRTSTGLARLGGVPAEERLAVCRTVAAELDTIAPPEVLSALAVTADPETATLLVGDLRAKADLLAVCDQDGTAVDVLVKEVTATHEVAVAWLTAIGQG